MILNTPQTLAIVAPRTTASTRQLELEAGMLVLRAAAAGRADFVVRRALRDATALAESPARRALVRAAEAIAADDVAATRAGLTAYAGVLERHGLHPEALTIYRGLLDVYGIDAGVALHAGRAARKSGDRAEAMRLYAMASDAAVGTRALELFAAIGRALVSEDAIGALAPVIACARREREWEAFAIAREERARLHRQAGRAHAALRDYAAAGRRYTDAIDRIRVLYALSDVLSGLGDTRGAREALLAAADLGGPSTRAHTVQRLRTLARATGDQLELRRTRGQGSAALVTMAPRARSARTRRSHAPRLQRLRDLLH